MTSIFKSRNFYHSTGPIITGPLVFFRSRQDEEDDGNDDDGSCYEDGSHDSYGHGWALYSRWQGSHHGKGMMLKSLRI